MGSPDALPTVGQVQEKLASLIRAKLAGFMSTATQEFINAAQSLEGRRLAMAEHQRAERLRLRTIQDRRQEDEARQRAARFRRGILGLWDRITGQYRRMHRQGEQEATESAQRDASERQFMIERQLKERQHLQYEIVRERGRHARELAALHRDMRNHERGAFENVDPLYGRKARRRRPGPSLD
jgi:hypothetical protein